MIGFGNSMGKLNNCILDEKYQVIERLGSKIRFVPPTIRPQKSSTLDLDYIKMMIGQRRNQQLLNSFLNMGNDGEIDELYSLQEEASAKMKSIDEELKTMKVVAGDFKVQKFMAETKAPEYKAQEYLHEFKNDVGTAVQKYKERQEIVKTFAKKNAMSE